MLRTIFSILSLALVVGGVSGILNRQTGACSSDEDCSLKETFLYCLNQRCQCLQGGTTTVHGVRVQLSMEWDAYRSKCVSQPGSLCTFKNRWYSSSDTTKLECSQDSSCIPNTAPVSGSNSQNSRFQQQEYITTENDFGVCWKNHQGQQNNRDRSPGVGGGGQSPFYPILTPGQQQNRPNRHEFEFATHGNRGYPISPTKVDNSAISGKYMGHGGIIILGIFINFWSRVG